MDEQERHIVTMNMTTYGGGFVKALGECVRRADPDNYKRLKNAFPDYWKKYYNDRKLMSEHGES